MTATVDHASSENAFDLLPNDLQQLLTRTAQTLSELGAGAVPDGGLDAPAVDRLFKELARLAPLRLLVTEGIEAPDGSPVARLRAVADHDEPAGVVVNEMRAAFAAAVAHARRARRANRRDARPSEADRAAARTEDKLGQARAARDRFAAQVDHLKQETAALRTRISELEDAQQEVSDQLDSTRHQLTTLRTQAADPVHLAAGLAEALEVHLGRPGEHPANSSSQNPFSHLDLTEVLDSPSAHDGADSEVPGRRFVSTLHRMLRALASPPAAQVGATHDRALAVSVLGGGEEIGGSCVLVTAANTRILVDCGARPGGRSAEEVRPREYLQALEGNLDAVVITHAHNDHAGWVPALVAERPGTPIYTTAATADLLGTMWFDSAKVMASNGVDAYTKSDVTRAIDAIRETGFGHVVDVADLSIELFPAGHIIGAAGVVVSAGGRRVVISGDVSGPGQETVGGFAHPVSAQGADLLLLETTYAGDQRSHQPRARVVRDFFTQVERVIDRGGIALVPAFALGRAQEVALLCQKHAPDVPVLIDGLARAVTEVYQRHPGPRGERRTIFTDQIRAVPRAGTAESARTFRGGVVITTSGMLNQGPAVTWARRVLPDPASALMVVGYQDEESPGARLLRLAEKGGGRFSLPGDRGMPDEPVEVLADVARYQLGAHADADELAAIVARMQARQLMLVHGEQRAQGQFAVRMRHRSQAVTATGTWTGS